MKRTWTKRLLSLACAGVMLVSTLACGETAKAGGTEDMTAYPQEIYKWTRIDDIDELRNIVKEKKTYRLLICHGSLSKSDGVSMPKLTHYLRLMINGSGGGSNGLGFTETPISYELGLNVDGSGYGNLKKTFYTLDGFNTPFIEIVDEQRKIEGGNTGSNHSLTYGSDKNAMNGVAVNMYLSSQYDRKLGDKYKLIAVAGKTISSGWFQMKKGYRKDYPGYNDYKYVPNNIMGSEDSWKWDSWKYNTEEWVLYSPTKTWPGIYNKSQFSSEMYEQLQGYLMIGPSRMGWTDYPVTLSYEEVPGNDSFTDPNKYLSQLGTYYDSGKKQIEDARRVFKCYLGELLKETSVEETKVAYSEIEPGESMTVPANSVAHMQNYTYIKKGAKVTVKKGGTLFISGTVFLDGLIVNEGGKVIVQSGTLIRNGSAYMTDTGQINCRDGGEIIVRRGARICMNNRYTCMELSGEDTQFINKGMFSFLGNIHVTSGAVFRNEKGAYLRGYRVLANGHQKNEKDGLTGEILDGYAGQKSTTPRIVINENLEALTKNCDYGLMEITEFVRSQILLGCVYYNGPENIINRGGFVTYDTYIVH